MRQDNWGWMTGAGRKRARNSELDRLMSWAMTFAFGVIAISGVTSAWQSLSSRTKITVWLLAAGVAALWLAHRLVRRTRRARKSLPTLDGKLIATVTSSQLMV